MFGILLLICAGCAGCGKRGGNESAKEPSTAEGTTEETTAETTAVEEETIYVPPMTIEDVSSYSNDVVTWGPGIQMGEDGRPVSCVAFQMKYESLGVDFLKENEKVIYLTFDQGYENGYTPQILDTLKEKGVSAVFFVTMPYAKEQTDLMKRMIAEGHVIGDHSVTHPSGGMPSLTVEEQLQEYQTLHQYVEETYGYSMYLTRPPAGIFSEQSLAVASHFGYRTVMWSFAYADWDPEKQMSEEAALTKMEERLHNGAIYLLHAVSKTNAAVLGDFIDYAKANGYEFRTYQ